ncbi:MAG: patatin-like phospholipase family protein [Taibaiella sp.]|nr:patatin-like phospholipase family protein [Taibaiella sp.]
MKNVLKSIYFFLPVQLVLLHFRKSQLLLSFWLILVLIILGIFGAHFGASSLLLVPEYLGQISFMSMFLLGSCTCVFMMSWHITTFIIHSKRLPYMRATRYAFVVYCMNNSIIPLSFLVFYSFISIRYQLANEHTPASQVLLYQCGFYLGFLILLLVSFAYFFRVSRDFFKSLLTTITRPSRIRRIIPYDALDYEIDMIPARTFITGRCRVSKTEAIAHYHPRVINTIMQRHHRNVIFAAFFSYFALLIMGAYMEHPLLRIPAGAGFLLLFSIIMGFVGAFKYFMKSWEALGWVSFAVLLSVLVKYQVFDLRSIAYGLNYRVPVKERPEYTYDNIHSIFSAKRFHDDLKREEHRLDNWKKLAEKSDSGTTMVVVTTSGGGSRSCYWTFNALQYVDSLTGGKLFKNTVLITGASGGMIGASYWRGVHDAYQQSLIKRPYDAQYQANMGKDLLNAIVFSLASVDLISPFNKISIAGYSYTRDRGYAMEQELIANTDSLLDRNMGYYREREEKGQIPQLIINGTIINDGRKLMMCNQPLTYLTQPEYSLNSPAPPIDAIDFSTFFASNSPYNLRITSALRMNATFPLVLPVVRLPSQPYMNIMDAGLRDNFGAEIATRYLFTLRGWIRKNVKNIILLELRDTREFDISDQSTEATLGNMLMDPLFAIQNKWECFQSYKHTYFKDYTPGFMGKRVHYVTMAYVPKEINKYAALNFHLTLKEKEDLSASIYNPENQAAVEKILKYLK